MKKDHPLHDKNLSIIYKGQRVYLFYDSAHLVKNIRNNLFGNKRFIFPMFEFWGFDRDIVVTGGEISLSLLHDVEFMWSAVEFMLKQLPANLRESSLTFTLIINAKGRLKNNWKIKWNFSIKWNVDKEVSKYFIRENLIIFSYHYAVIS